MKILKIALAVLAVIILIPLILGVLVPKEYGVEREIIIDRPHSEVFEYTKLLKNQDYFSKWASMDPQMKKTYKGTDGNVGFVSAWESENPEVGKGEQEIIGIQDGKRIDYTLRFKEPFESSDKAYMEFESVGENQTKVIWGFDGRMGYPMNTMLLFMDMEKLVGEDFEAGLMNLKRILEK